MKTLMARQDRPIPPAYWLAAGLAGVVVLGCYATAYWFPELAVQWALPFVPSSYGLASGLALLFGGALGLSMAAVGFLALRWPGLAICLAVLPILPSLLDATPVHFGVIAALAAVALTASWRRPDASVAAIAVAGLVVTGWLLSGRDMAAPFRSTIELAHGGPRWMLGVLYGVALLLVLAGAMWLRTSQLHAAEAGALAARSEAVEEQAAVVGERARLARDLHDVVAHHVSLIAVRAETAPYTDPGLSESARSVLSDIAADARLALDELRGVLGILSRSGGGSAARAPQPTWSDVTALVERTRSAGVDVRLEGAVTAEVGAAAGYAAYRVVQESLTNARRHAPGATVTVTLTATAGLLVVRVATMNLTPGRSGDRPGVGTGVAVGAPVGAAGRGLVGMRERLEALGGRLVVGPAGSEFVVEATLPRGAGGAA